MALVGRLTRWANNPVKREMRAFLQSLDYNFTEYVTIFDFIPWVEQHWGRGKQLRLLPRPLSPALFGAWLTSDEAELFFYDTRVAPAQQPHLILHELSHWLLDHPTRHLSQGEVKALLALPHEAVADRLLEIGLRRSVGTDKQEQQAETLARLFQQAVRRAQRGRGSSNPWLNRFLEGMDLL